MAATASSPTPASGEAVPLRPLDAQYVLAAIRYDDLRFLREKAIQLKRQDGEGWAIGEMVERACTLFEEEREESQCHAKEEEEG